MNRLGLLAVQGTPKSLLQYHSSKALILRISAFFAEDTVSPSTSLSQQEASISLLLPSAEDRQNENHNHRKLTNLTSWAIALSNSMKLWAMLCRATKMDRSWWRVLTKCGPLEEGMASYFSILALRIPWTVWKEMTKLWVISIHTCGVCIVLLSD